MSKGWWIAWIVLFVINVALFVWATGKLIGVW